MCYDVHRDEYVYFQSLNTKKMSLALYLADDVHLIQFFWLISRSTYFFLLNVFPSLNHLIPQSLEYNDWHLLMCLYNFHHHLDRMQSSRDSHHDEVGIGFQDWKHPQTLRYS